MNRFSEEVWNAPRIKLSKTIGGLEDACREYFQG